jgi:HEAT repeat protein/predicted ABC-type transport system involved in lysophospholipase L1 biosynthesis ATPase subunit
MLAKHPLRQHATEENFELDIYVPLGLMERKQQQRRPANQDLPMEEVYKLEEKEEITRQFEHNQFLEHIGLGSDQAESTKSIAIIGEPGAGKSTLLEKIAKEIDEQNKGLPICISLANLEGLTIEEYLEKKWLKDALLIIQQQLKAQVTLSVREVPKELKEALAQEFTNTQQGGVWLLLDGLDEMKTNSPTEALSTIEKQIGSGYLAEARIVLSCRTNVWDANLTNPFSKFNIYKTLEFKDFQRDNFIHQWFKKLNKSQLETDLITKLKETGKERICELVKNPLRLVLLCRIWTLQQGQLPETKAEFYQRYFPYFYNWKKNIRDLTRQSSKRTELHQALGKLAIEAIKSGSRYRLKESLACEEMGEELFELAEALGWLNIVDRDLATEEAVYAFFHPTFQEYFAACAIKDWDFFLPRNHVDKPVQGKEYRIFEPKWKEVILLWLGREYISKKKKEEFINALVDFEDGCSPVNSEYIDRGCYEYRAYFLAAAGINEFKECSRTKEIVEQVVTWSFEYYIQDITNLDETALIETNRTEAIAALEELIDFNLVELIGSNTNEYTEYIEYILSKIAERLGKIDPRNKIAVSTLEKLIDLAKDKYIFSRVVEVLGKVDPENPKFIHALDDMLNNFARDGHLDYHSEKILIEIAPGNEQVIETLVNLINYDKDKDTLKFKHKRIRNGAGYLLEKIGVGNNMAISALVDLITSVKDGEICYIATRCLGEIGVGNTIVISALEKLIVPTRNECICYYAAESLVKINPKNQIAHDALDGLMEFTRNQYICCQAAESLVKINPKNQIACDTLERLMNFTKNKYIYGKAAEILVKNAPDPPKFIDALVDVINSVENKYRRAEEKKFLAEITSRNKIAFAIIVKFMLFIEKLVYYIRDKSLRREAVKSLGTIAPGNTKAIDTLVELVKSARNKSLREEAVKSLGTIAPGNIKAIDTLVELVKSARNKFLRKEAVKNLGTIAPGNTKAIDTLVELINSTSDYWNLREATESLEKILTKPFMPKVVKELKNTTNKEAVKILWDCAQNLSYPEFYSSWHS